MIAFPLRRPAKGPLGGAYALAWALAWFVAPAQGALSLSQSRIVYPSEQRNVALIVSNPSKNTWAAQTWVNTAADDTSTPVPFIATPPLFRLDPGAEQQVRITGLPSELPKDRETLFYFNVQEIPSVEGDSQNVLSIALRTRIKLFYRPAEIRDTPLKRLGDLSWSIRQRNGKPQLVVHNTTPFHVTFARLQVVAGEQVETVEMPAMSAPFSEQAYALKAPPAGAVPQVRYSAINDYGAATAPLTRPIALSP